MKVIKIGAEWCPGCIVMRPRWKEIEGELPWLETSYLDYDDDHDEAVKFVKEDGNLPTFVFVSKDGQEILRLQGEISKPEIIKAIEENKNK